METRLSTLRASEPDAKDAWLYTRRFFEAAPGAKFGVVQRSWFETRLRAHTNSPNRDDEPAWYALRNVIFATGSRLHLAKTTTFREACQISWGWFENALSVHTEILYFKTSILGLQALTLMAYFVDELGSPALEYMLCSNALRLACSKGLHRQAVSSWNLTPQEACQRDWIFWAIYCLEKSIALRSGRPSITDDDDISCQIPIYGPPGSAVDVVFCNLWIRFAQLSSLVSKRLSSVQAFRRTTSATIDNVIDLDQQLRSLKDSMAYIFCVDAPINPSSLPAGMSLNQALDVQFTYYDLLSHIHTALTYPWSQAMLRPQENDKHRKQIETSCSIVADAARSIILATKWVHLDANCSVLSAFTASIQAVINLFIHILQYPENPSVQWDLSLLDIGAGHFARLEFATRSQISISFVKDIASLARAAVRRAKNGPVTCGGSTGVRTLANLDSVSSESDMVGGPNHSQPTGMNQEAFDIELSDFQPENLSMLLPGIDLDGGMTDFFNWEQ
ncbi:uncharacterized protein A1O5_08097 [Cladophialophora psammophila CBS 110553]|uniref:Xylanolytic transcriptional activator regulatory domain-containing protein n=1 Tax=Cladophialophora psammophila CBS 110553 TaxID=1182543 RepID=W9WLU6_9EURO|nr:uncharacterized protein A1O5_08097 [Cladophialophora psammophila CBS 110553]EXJ69162.1 hypothetical protein A1O5_08097 [Cladophialophora psammophila CBS 110553]